MNFLNKEIKVIRIYDQIQSSGYRILVDRLWPRGMSKGRANLDGWAKEIAPSKELRQWFNHEDKKYTEFKQKYEIELTNNPALPNFMKVVHKQLIKQDVVLLYAAKNKEHNQAVVLKNYLDNQFN